MNSGTGLWTIGTLNNGATATLNITATVDVGTSGNYHYQYDHSGECRPDGQQYYSG